MENIRTALDGEDLTPPPWAMRYCTPSFCTAQTKKVAGIEQLQRMTAERARLQHQLAASRAAMQEPVRHLSQHSSSYHTSQLRTQAEVNVQKWVSGMASTHRYPRAPDTPHHPLSPAPRHRLV